MTHTRGPWKAHRAIWDKETGDVAYILEGIKEARAADSYLITAAPVMLEALVSMLSIISESNGISGWHLNGNIATWGEFQVVIDIEEAIRKARGEE